MSLYLLVQSLSYLVGPVLVLVDLVHVPVLVGTVLVLPSWPSPCSCRSSSCPCTCWPSPCPCRSSSCPCTCWPSPCPCRSSLCPCSVGLVLVYDLVSPVLVPVLVGLDLVLDFVYQSLSHSCRPSFCSCSCQRSPLPSRTRPTQSTNDIT